MLVLSMLSLKKIPTSIKTELKELFDFQVWAVEVEDSE